MPDPNDLPPSQPPPPRPAPQRVGAAAKPAQPEPKPKRGKWLAAVFVAGLAIVALVVAAVLLVHEQNKGPTPEEQVRASIDTYMQALTSGDLGALRTTTCGALADYYRTIPDAEFAQVHDVAVAQKALPVVQSVDQVQITDNHRDRPGHCLHPGRTDPICTHFRPAADPEGPGGLRSRHLTVPARPCHRAGVGSRGTPSAGVSPWTPNDRRTAGRCRPRRPDRPWPSRPSSCSRAGRRPSCCRPRRRP